MTNGANYKRGKLHYCPWHSDIRTSNQLNISVPPCGNERAHCSEIECVPPGYVSIHSPLRCTQLVSHDEYTMDCERDDDFILHLLTDEGPSTG